MTFLRRLTAVVALVALAAPASGAAAVPVRTAAFGVYEVRSVDARWYVPSASPGRVTMYSVRATVRVDPASGETVERARTSRLRCRVEASSVQCDSAYGGARLTKGRPTELTIADDLSSATLVASDRFGETRVSWTASGTPRGLQVDESCPAGSGLGFGLFQPTGASGSVWGRPVTPSNERDHSGATRFVTLTPC